MSDVISPSAPAAVEASARNLRKTVVGTVVSAKMDKTIVVETVNRVAHPKFKKIIKKSHKFYAHDEDNKAVLGDKVEITETRPLSKLKRWRLLGILSH